MIQFARAIRPSSTTSPDIVRVVVSPPAGNTGIDTRFVSVPLFNVRAMCGEMSGERFHSPDDFVPGDELRIASAAHARDATSEISLNPFGSFAEEDGEFIAGLTGYTQKLQILLMADTGILVGAYAITPANETCAQTYLLLPHAFDPARLYSVLVVHEI